MSSSDSDSSSSSSSGESISSNDSDSRRARSKKSQLELPVDPNVPVELPTQDSVADPNLVQAIPPDAIPDQTRPASAPTKRKAKEIEYFKFSMSEDRGKRLRELVATGLSKDEAKDLRSRYTPSFKEGSFALVNPEMDEPVYRRLKQVKGSSSSKEKIDSQETEWRSLQYKVLDIVRPMLYVWKTSKEGNVRDAAKVAIRQWTHAHFSITERRRKNLLKQTNPSFLSLLKKDKNFSDEEFDSLFGDFFLEKMIKTAKDDALLNAVSGRSGGPNSHSGRSYRGGTNNGRGSQHSFRSSGFNQQSSFASNGQNNRGGSFGSASHQNGRYDSFVPVAISNLDYPVGGRLKYFASNWTIVSKDPWVLNVVSDGLIIDFAQRPIQSSRPRDTVMGDEEMSTCDIEIHSLVEKRAIVQSSGLDKESFFSSIFVVPKKGGRFRPIANLKALNAFVVYRHFKMEGNSMLKLLVMKGDRFTKMDLRDAYLTVPIHPSCQKFLHLQWREKFFKFSSLPFGLSSAPWAFTKLLRPVVAYLRKHGVRLIVYLDDILIVSADEESSRKDFKFVRSLFEFLGFMINEEKSVETPSNEIEFLGLIVDSNNLSVALPKEKIDSIIQICTVALRGGSPSLREMATILGKFAWATFALPYAQAHYRNFQELYISRSREHSHLESLVELTDLARSDLIWWIENLERANGKPLRQTDPELVIFSDASLTGWGGCCNEVKASGPWGPSDRGKHINELELVAAFNCLKTFAEHATGLAVLMQLDNATAVAYINKSGGSRSYRLNRVAIDIINWCEDKRIEIQAVFSTRFVELYGRQGVPSPDRFQRLETVNRDVLEASFEMGGISGSLCIRLERATTEIRQLDSTTRGVATERALVQLEGSTGIRVSPLCPDKGLFVQDNPGGDRNRPSVSSLARSTVVPDDIEPGSRPSLDPNSEQEASNFTRRTTTPVSRDGIDYLSRVEAVREEWSSRGFSSEVVDLLVAGTRSTTQTAYQSAWVSWRDWCLQRGTNPLPGSLNDVLDFLAHLFKSGKAYNTVNVARSMLSGTLSHVDGQPVGQHPLVVNLMKGIYNSNPPKPRYESTWSVDAVLDHLNNLPINSELSIAALSRKLAFLLAVTSLLRVSEVATISRQSVILNGEGLIFSLSKPRKAQSKGALHSIIIAKFSQNPKICPVSCVGHYLYATDNLRNNDNNLLLFIATVKPHRPVSGSTLARWIKDMLKESGIDTTVFKAHSTRGAAASKAAKAGVKMDTILQTAHWAKESTFSKFYRRDVALSEGISEAVLSVARDETEKMD